MNTRFDPSLAGVPRDDGLRLPLKALIVEDSEDDALLLVDHLTASGFLVSWKQVDNEADMRAALESEHWEIVFSDYTMPRFRGDQALEVARRHDPDLPFIFVSGTIGEEAAVAAMRAGAQDYVMKHDLSRLPPAVRRELEDAGDRRARHNAEEALRKLSLAVEQTADCVFITDPQGRIEYVNPAFENLTGYRAHEALGQTPNLVKYERNSPEYFQRMWAILLSGEVFRDTVVNRRKDGSLFYEEKTITPLTDDDGHISHFVSTGRDVTERVHADEARARLTAILESTPDFVATADADGRLLYLNSAGRRMLGLGEGFNIEGMRLSDCYSDWGAQHLAREALPGAARDGVWEGENSLRGDPDADIPVSQVILAHRDEHDQLVYFSTIAREITERKRYETELRHLATHDSLTGLPNRTLLLDRLNTDILSATRGKHMLALIFIDLDNFKRVNDSLGHVAGDSLLREVGQRLQRCMRPSDTVARYGGDEFVVLCGDLDSADHAIAIMTKLGSAFEPVFRIAGRDLFVTFSAGVALYPADGLNAEALLKNSDTAMFRSKAVGRNQFQFYAPDMNAHSQEMLDMETGLRRALRRGEFLIHYQPQLDLRSGRIAGCEALLRWHREPGDALIQPGDFVPMLEETGLILPVGEWVLRHACAQWRGAQAVTATPPRISVNVSARQFSDDGLVDLVARVLKEEAMRPEALELEITESTVMQDVQRAGEVLKAMDALGVRLAVDDFGTGYSSLAYLKRFPLDTLKIDAAFIRDLPHDPDDAAITQASIALGHKLGFELVAEGVENRAQIECLRRYECDLVQGFYLSRPLSIPQVISFMQRYPRNLA